jgi:predicted AAA+ superfamily ATPase
LEFDFQYSKRDCAKLVRLLTERLALFPAVALVGPRQCGKTTLARKLGGRYFNLEDADERTRLDAQWHDVLAGPAPIVFDEAQNWPELFSRLRGAIDAQRKKNGRFVLLGSVSPSLMRNVSESLAGRMAVLDLTPFHLEEVRDVPRLWRFGGFPDGGVLGQPSIRFGRKVTCARWPNAIFRRGDCQPNPC